MKQFVVEKPSIVADSIRVILVSYIVMFCAGIFAEVMRVRLIQWDDPASTLESISGSIPLFTTSIFAFLLVIVLDVIIAFALNEVFSPRDRSIANLMVVFRLVYVAIKGFAIVGLVMALELVTNDGARSTSQPNVVMQLLRMHHHGFAIGLVFFGAHLVFLAVLLFRCSVIRKTISWLVLFAGVGYSVTSLITLLVPQSGAAGQIAIGIFILPMTFAEIIFAFALWKKRILFYND